MAEAKTKKSATKNTETESNGRGRPKGSGNPDLPKGFAYFGSRWEKSMEAVELFGSTNGNFPESMVNRACDGLIEAIEDARTNLSSTTTTGRGAKFRFLDDEVVADAEE